MADGTDSMIPITKPFMDELEAQAAANAIRSGWIAQGTVVAEFEAAFAVQVGAAHGVAVNSCTAALHLALICSGVGRGDEVVLPSLTFIATANAVLHAGAVPVFADVDPQTYNITADAIGAALTPRTKAILTVDQIGLSADHDPILALAARRGLPVVEDAAPAVGATYKGRPIGSLGPVTCFSFHPRKSISTGEGGMIVTDSEALAARARVLRSHGASVSDLARHRADTVMTEEYAELGFNYRMTDIQAAIGLEQLKKLDHVLAARRRLAERYRELLADLPGIAPPREPPWAAHTYQSFAIRLDPARTPPREAVMARMLAQGVATRRGVMAIHEEPYYQDWARARGMTCHLPVTEAVTRETLLLPIYTTMTDAEQERVAEALSASLQH